MLSQSAWASTLTDRLALFPFRLPLQLALTHDLTDLSESYTGDSAGKSSVAAYDSFRGAALTRPSAATFERFLCVCARARPPVPSRACASACAACAACAQLVAVRVRSCTQMRAGFGRHVHADPWS